MIPRNRLDIRWLELWFALRCCTSRSDAAALDQRLEEQWSPGSASLACLSVRSGFDALLTALDLPPGSEILVSALTIRDMVRIIEAHRLVAVPIDLDMQRLELRADLLARAITPRTKAAIVAHLFGSRMPLGPLLEIAHERGLVIIEDCAQGYVGDSFRGHAASDVSMFSFGTIKTATALGGSLLRFRDPELGDRVRRVQAAWPQQSQFQYAQRIAKLALLQLLVYRLPFSAFTTVCGLLGINHDRLIARSVRGFAGGDLFAKIRRRPCGALLALLARRLEHPDPAAIAGRIAVAKELAARLPRVDRPGKLAAEHTHWVFPIYASDPETVVRHLWARGIDATCGATSLYVVPPPADQPESVAAEATGAYGRLLYLPAHAALSARDIDRLVAAVSETARTQEAALIPTSGRLGFAREECRGNSLT